MLFVRNYFKVQAMGRLKGKDKKKKRYILLFIKRAYDTYISLYLYKNVIEN